MGMTKTTRSPDGMFANEGGVAQEGPLPLYVCNACREYVVWATSSRTGRKYLVTVQRGYHGQRYYNKRNVHPRDCAERKAARDAEIAAAFGIDA
jgi:hypothetical protein